LPKELEHVCNKVVVLILVLTRGVSHCGLANYIKKYLKQAKEKL
jgi:hypothetical protein